MDTFYVALEIGGPLGGRFESIQALVDTGTTYSWVPASVLSRLEVKPTFRFPFVLADGRRIERDMAETRVRLSGEGRTTIVVFGDEGTQALMGAYALEGFGLSADPVNRRLVPATGFLL